MPERFLKQKDLSPSINSASPSSRDYDELVNLLCEKNKIINEIMFQCSNHKTIESKKMIKIIKNP